MASLTWDQGTELAYHRKLTVATDVSVYLCDPKSPLSADCKSNRPPGSAGATKIPMVCCANTVPMARTYPSTSKETSIRLPCASTRDRGNTRPRKTLRFQAPADTDLPPGSSLNLMQSLLALKEPPHTAQPM
jgi:hypothetical protein